MRTLSVPSKLTPHMVIRHFADSRRRTTTNLVASQSHSCTVACIVGLSLCPLYMPARIARKTSSPKAPQSRYYLPSAMHTSRVLAGVLMCSLSVATTVWSMTLADRDPSCVPYSGMIAVIHDTTGGTIGYLDTGADGPRTVDTNGHKTGFNLLYPTDTNLEHGKFQVLFSPRPRERAGYGQLPGMYSLLMF